MSTLQHAGDWAKLMVCEGDKGPLLEKLRCTKAQREKKTPEGWLESGVHRAGWLLAVAAAVQSFPGLRGQGKTGIRQGA